MRHIGRVVDAPGERRYPPISERTASTRNIARRPPSAAKQLWRSGPPAASLPHSEGIVVVRRRRGFASATFAAMILTDRIAGRPNPGADTFSVIRLSTRSMAEVAKLAGKYAVDVVGDRIKTASGAIRR
jgi:hypothetical protein